MEYLKSIYKLTYNLFNNRYQLVWFDKLNLPTEGDTITVNNMKAKFCRGMFCDELLKAELLQRFNDYEVPLKMTAKEVREIISNYQ